MGIRKSPGAPKIRRLHWDIEVTPNVVLAFRAGFGLTINHDSIVEERKVICIGFKWEDEGKVTVLRWDKNKDDKALLKKFLAVAKEADELVAHFGDRFDFPWVRTRCLFHGFSPLPLFKTIDTKAWASKYFYFNSNKLDYLSKFLGHGGKEKMEFDDWKAITLLPVSSPQYIRALDKMCHYCGVDVLKLEKVFKDLRFCVKPKTHAGVLGGRDKWTCPWDGSRNVVKNKTRVTSVGTIQFQMQCLDCGGYYTINQRAYEDYLKAKSKKKARRRAT